MRYLFVIFFLIGCSENNNSYFPLAKKKYWSYKIEIKPEIDQKTVYKKVNLSLGEKKLQINGEKESQFIHYLEKMVQYIFILIIKMEYIEKDHLS